MASYKDFLPDLIKRSVNLVEEYQGDKEVTLLINCLLGLLVLPKEKCYDKIPETPLKDLNDWGIRDTHIRHGRCDCCKRPFNTINLRQLVRRMRNSVAHMKIRVLDDGKHISEINFKDKTLFEATVPVECLRTFVKKLTDFIINESGC